MEEIPPVTGKQLIELLMADGWEIRATVGTHGVCLRKRFPDRVRVTVVPNKRGVLPPGTLGAILGPKQTALGKVGLRHLPQSYGPKGARHRPSR